MPWAKLDDQIYFNRKMQECDGFARSFHIAAIVYCAGQLTDGYIPRPVLALITAMTGFEFTRKQMEGVVAQLLASGLWEEADNGYRIHDYLGCGFAADPTTQTLRRCRDYDAWRSQVLSRDEHTCTQCGAQPLTLHAHNGQTLCEPCHWQAHGRQ